MLAVHALWLRGRGLLLWAEDGDHPVRSPSQAARSGYPHPFAVPAQALTEIHPGKPSMATILLPSLLAAPLDSVEPAGQMPTDIEGVFAAAGSALFPAGVREPAMDCSCVALPRGAAGQPAGLSQRPRGGGPARPGGGRATAPLPRRPASAPPRCPPPR